MPPGSPSLDRLALRHPGGTTRIVIGVGALAEAAAELAEPLAGRTLFLVSTPRVLELHREAVAGLGGSARQVVALTVPDGEEAKDLATAGRLWSEMLAAGGKRDSAVVAFGGGSCTDLAGFAAGCFLRGIELIQVPTTLLGQVDAAIGGKTAIDLPGAKNSVGAFHHPSLVVCDTSLLATLPPGELRSGLVESIKMAFLLDPALLGRIEEGLEALLAGDPSALAPVVVGSVAAKVAVVEADPREGGARQLLNFGHTLGHAIEAALGYRGLRHGEAVAYGMLFALRLAARRGLPPADGARLAALLGRLGLPPLPPLAAGDLVAAMARDKKAREDGLVWVLPDQLGRGRSVAGIATGEVESALELFFRDPWG